MGNTMRYLILILLFVCACGDDLQKSKNPVPLPTNNDQDAGTSSEDGGQDIGVESDSSTTTDIGESDLCATVSCVPNAVCVEVGDGATCECLEGFVMTNEVCEPDGVSLVFTNLPATESSQTGEADTYQIQAAGPPADPLTFSLVDKTCTFSINVNASGLASWTCSTPETCSANIRVAAGDKSATGVLSIDCVATLPKFTSTPTATAQEGIVYRYSPTCTDPNGASVAIVAGAGDTCGGTITGGAYEFTPSETQGGGSCVLKVGCSNGDATETQSAVITIAETNVAPVFTGQATTHSTHAGDSDSFSVSATDADSPSQNVVLSKVSTTCGFAVSVSANGTVAYTCDGIETCAVVVSASDGVASTNRTESIACTNTAPTVANVTISPVTIDAPGQPLSCGYTFSDADGDSDMSQISWLVDGVAVASGTTFSGYAEFDVISCKVTPDDGFSTGTAKTSPAKTAPAAVMLEVSRTFACGRTQSRTLMCWGATPSDSAHLPTYEADDVEDFCVTDDNICYIVAGTVTCTGDWTHGVKGNSSSTIFDATMLTGASDIACGKHHVCAVKNGGLWCWGRNDDGQVARSIAGNTPGYQTNTNFGSYRTDPAVVSGMSSGVTAMALGASHTCAVQNGAVKCFGTNRDGQLGRATNVGQLGANSTPGQVTGLGSSVTQIAGGDDHTCAIAGGVLKCWGSSIYDAIGYATPANTYYSATATSVGIGTIQGVYAGGRNTCVVQSNVVKCWGSNDDGQLVSGSTTNTPQTLLGAPSYTVGVGNNVVCGQKNASIYCWGRNTSGALGNLTGVGTNTTYGPTVVLGL